MGDDEIGRLNQGTQLSDIDHLSRHHLVGDASQTGDLIGLVWLLQAAVDANDVTDIAGPIEGEPPRRFQ
ncbi:hypothetical protein GGE12_004202 [Rhizobium mongolense]|uniref:Uncharacterized protein n=1 Tax=Rhizobium mongolense TaxID=57676 RepID=A0A7W6RR68_9HYPH|nr:hypothetical protein [Rhizobium mongolense]